MSLDIICHVPLNQEVMNPVSCDSSVIRVMNGTVSYVRACHAAAEVKVHSITTQPESLTTIAYLSVFNPVRVNTGITDTLLLYCMEEQ